MPVSLSEATRTLLSGGTLSWAKFGDYKAGSIQLQKPGARRLFQFLLSCEQSKVAEANDELFTGLIGAWQDAGNDPAASTTTALAKSTAGVNWRLLRLESSGFGGLNQIGGPNFVLPIDGVNWCLEGQNGSGKTSIASAIIWALTGYRCRDQDGVIIDDGRRTPVYNDSGLQIGTWPPTVSFPASPSLLGGVAEAWVRLTFQNEQGDTAEAFRRLVVPPTGASDFQAKIDPVLLSAPQLIETGLLMPARLARIGFGDRSQTIYDAVKLLTGLDQLADIGEGAANFSHKAKRFLKYGVDNGLLSIETRLDHALNRASEEAAKAGFDLKITGKRQDDEYAKELRDCAEGASTLAGNFLDVLTSDVATGLDTTKPADRTKIKNSVSAARGILEQNTKGIPVFDAWKALKAATEDPEFPKLSEALVDAGVKLADAVAWDKRQAEDAKLRLKAVASQFFAGSPHAHEDADCPLCESKLSGEKRKALAAELTELKEASDAAERRLSDACAALEKYIRDLLPDPLKLQFAALTSMQPRDAFETALNERFSLEPPFSTILTGMAEFAASTAATFGKTLPFFEYKAAESEEDLPAAAQSLKAYLGQMGRLVALVSWWAAQRETFLAAWNSLRGIADTEGQFPAESLEGKLGVLEAALEKATPLDDLATHLRNAADEAEKWLVIHKEQLVREDIASALEPLKDLRALVAVETATSISALAGRMKSVLDRIHFSERLSFQGASLSKKSVQISASLHHGIRIDAATVANSSWLRAILWAFVLAMREQTIEALGTNPFPLMVLDDPQTTFDPRNKRKWAEEIARYANADPAAPESMQLVVVTHERQFFQLLVNIEKLTGQQGLVVQLSDASKVATVVNGHSLSRCYVKAVTERDDAAGHQYVFEVRTYCEDLLKIMLRSEGPDVADLSLDSLANHLKKLREGSTSPFNRPPFEKLLNTIAGGGGAKSIKIINESHHKFDGTIGVAQATEVKQFWEKTLQTQIHTCFKIYAEYESYTGEPRLFPWMDNVIEFPEGNSAEVRKFTLIHTGVAAAAKSDGRVGDGLITIEELEDSPKITLHNHNIYQLAAGTLDPIAAIGDVIIASNYAKVHPRNLVAVAFGDQLLARRYNEVEIHPHITVLTGQSTDPYAIAQPVIAPAERIKPCKIVGTVFAASRLSTPLKNDNVEFIALGETAVISSLLENAKVFKVVGRSAEPIALDGQYLMAQSRKLTPDSLIELDGHLVIAVDENGGRYFKRLRRRDVLILLESLNPDGTAPAEVLSVGGEMAFPRISAVMEVVGVLFELPT